MDDKLEEFHQELLAWATSIGVDVNGIRPTRISGRGSGIVATKHIPKDTDVLVVPVTALRTRDTIRDEIRARAILLKDATVHCLLAADLALDNWPNNDKFREWQAAVPNWQDIQLSMPLAWPASLQSLLPTAAGQLLDKQRKKFEKDWALLSAALPIQNAIHHGCSMGSRCTRDEYMYAWLLVNTRTFYFVTPQTEKLPKEDHMALPPVADLFNHTDKGGCHVSFDPTEGFTFRTTRSYQRGNEVHISYGPHTNDFLLVEYGFVMAQNQWDDVCLDDVILPALSRYQKEGLDDAGFLGNYVLDRDTVCHRTEVALRRLNVSGRADGLSMRDWRQFVNGLDDGAGSQAQADALLASLLEKYKATITSQQRGLRDLDFQDTDGDVQKHVNESRRDILLRRWEQIRDLVNATVWRLETALVESGHR